MPLPGFIGNPRLQCDGLPGSMGIIISHRANDEGGCYVGARAAHARIPIPGDLRGRPRDIRPVQGAHLPRQPHLLLADHSGRNGQPDGPPGGQPHHRRTGRLGVPIAGLPAGDRDGRGLSPGHPRAVPLPNAPAGERPQGLWGARSGDRDRLRRLRRGHGQRPLRLGSRNQPALRAAGPPPHGLSGGPCPHLPKEMAHPGGLEQGKDGDPLPCPGRPGAGDDRDHGHGRHGGGGAAHVRARGARFRCPADLWDPSVPTARHPEGPGGRRSQGPHTIIGQGKGVPL